MNGLSKRMLFVVMIIAAAGCQSASDPSTLAGMASSEPDQKIEKITAPDVAGVLLTASEGEIGQAQAALPHLTSSSARDFANMMVTEHTLALTEARGMFASAGIVSRDSSATARLLHDDSKRNVSSLNKMAANADREYMQMQVDVHSSLLSTIDSELMPVSKGDLRNLLARQRATVAAHLERARQVLAGLP